MVAKTYLVQICSCNFNQHIFGVKRNLRMVTLVRDESLSLYCTCTSCKPFMIGGSDRTMPFLS